jgi:predicted PhzF superfamily epimerase YddE/YHI9
VHVVRVFVDERGGFGNPLGIVLDAGALDRARRQWIATRLGYSETVFLDDLSSGRLQLFTPSSEIAFAGHPLVGTSWLIERLSGRTPEALRPVRVARPVPSFVQDGRTWVRGATSDAPDWEHVRLDSAAEIDRLTPPRPGGRWQTTQVWAWLDEPAGLLRARVFASAFGVPEDEACGSATLLLCAALGRQIQVRHGAGSVVHARPAGPGRAEVGGAVAMDGIRELSVVDHSTG